MAVSGRSSLLLVPFVALCCSGILADFTVTISQPSERRIVSRVGESLLLNCTISGSRPASTITWYKDGEFQNNSSGSGYWLTHSISPVNAVDGGYYKCTADCCNQSQKDSAGVFVNVEGKPIIIRKGYSHCQTTTPYLTFYGRAARLHCCAAGNPAPGFRWYKNGIRVDSNYTGYILVKQSNGLDLLLFDVKKQQRGNYTCQASNKHGMDARSIDVRVFGQGPSEDPTVTAVQPVVRGHPGDPNITLACIGENSVKLDTSTMWYYNGSRLLAANNARIKIQAQFYDQNDPSISPKVKTLLTFLNLTLSDAGRYICEVATDTKHNGNSSVFLHVTEKHDARPTRSPGAKVSVGVITGICIAVVLVIIIVISIIWCVARKRKQRFPKVRRGGPYKYDVFVTYNSKDYGWVKANLLPLFQKHDISCCIHYHNFEIGIPYYENMVNSVYDSRVVIVVMSKNYMASSYCRQELDYAVHRSVEEHGSSPLIIIRVDGIKKTKLPRVLQHNTFLDYTSNVEQATWQRRLLEHVQLREDSNENREDGMHDQNENQEIGILDHDENQQDGIPDQNEEQEQLVAAHERDEQAQLI